MKKISSINISVWIYIFILLSLILFILSQFYYYQKGLKEVEYQLDLQFNYELEKLQAFFYEEINSAILFFENYFGSLPSTYSPFEYFDFIAQRHLSALPLKVAFFFDKKNILKFYGQYNFTLPLKDLSQTEKFITYVQNAYKTKKVTFYLGNFLFFSKDISFPNTPFFVIIAPVFWPTLDNYIGAFVGFIDIKNLLEKYLNHLKKFIPQASFFIIDEKGIIIYHPDSSFCHQPFKKIFKDIPSAHQDKINIVIEQILKEEKGSCDGYDSRLVYTAFYFPDKTRWVFVYSYPKNLRKTYLYPLIKGGMISAFLLITFLALLLFTINRFYTSTIKFVSPYYQAIKSLIDPFVITDLNGRIIYANPAFKRYLSNKVKEGEKLCAISPDFHRGEMPLWHREMLNSIKKGKDYELPRYCFETAQGETFWTRVVFSVLKDAKGNPNYVAIDFNDITRQVKLEKTLEEYTEQLEELVIKRTQDLIESEEQYRQIFETQLMGIFIIQPTGEFLMFNEKFKEISGYNEEELLKLNFKSMCSPTERAALQKLFQDCLNQQSVFYREMRFFPKEKHTIFVDLFLQATRFKRETAILGFIYDITQRKALEEKLREQDRIAVLGEMAAGVAHDINNLLMMIMGNLELVNFFLEKNPIKAKSYLEKALNVAEEGEGIVRRLYAYAHKRLQTAEVISDLNKLLKETVLLTKPFWRTQARREGKEINVIEEYGNVGPIAGTPVELKEVFINLIKNAVEAIPEKGEIFIKTWQENKMNCVMIKDNGQGIPETIMPKIFEPFFSTKGEKGSGLGLAVSLGIVRAHGGDIKVESKEGKGATFYVYLPIIDPNLIVSLKKKEEVIKSSSLRKKKILVVDDEVEILTILREILTNLGIENFGVEIPYKAIELMKKFKDEIGLVITDLGMPEMSGFELAEKIKEITPETPIILLTGWGAAVSLEEIQAHKIDDVLSKPLGLDKLKELLKKYGFEVK